jgi:Sulfotransferase domain
MRAYFGHHKCASTWIYQIVQRVCREIGVHHYSVIDELTPTAHGSLASHSTRDRGTERAKGKVERPKLRERVEEGGGEFVSCITADRDQLESLRPERAFHVIRDPRDMIVSGYFSHRNSHPTNGLPHIAAHRESLQSVPKEEGLLLEMDFASRVLLDLGEWDYDRPEVLELRMEDLAARPYEGFIEVFRHLELLSEDEPTAGRDLAATCLRRSLNRLSSRRPLRRLRRPMPATAEILLGAVYGLRFEAATKGRRAGVEDTASHYRKGVAGDWVNHFTQVHVDAFDERFGGLLERLGYETEALSLSGSS